MKDLTTEDTERTERATPETDALVLKKQPFGGTDYEWIELSRRLERDRNEARKAIHIAESLIKPQIERERDSWEQTAAHYLDGMHYYRGLVERVGKALGEAAYTQDDGGKVDSVLCAKVPELVVDLKRERDEAREALSGRTVSCAACNHAAIERDEARKKAERYRLEANAMMLQRDEAQKHLRDIEEYGTEEINAAVELRQKLAAALRERDEARKPSAWIPVARALPDDDATVLIHLADGGVEAGFLDAGHWRFVSGDRIETPVLHWRTFPDAPPPSK